MRYNCRAEGVVSRTGILGSVKVKTLFPVHYEIDPERTPVQRI